MVGVPGAWTDRPEDTSMHLKSFLVQLDRVRTREASQQIFYGMCTLDLTSVHRGPGTTESFPGRFCAL